MGYDNTYKLKIAKSQSITKSILLCDKCNHEFDSGKFCQECGETLSILTKTSEMHPIEIISKFRGYSEDASFLLEDSGGSRNSGSGYDLEEDLLRFSAKYPDVVFQLDVKWDSGFGDDPSRVFVKDGVKKDIVVKMVYEDFDPNNF